MPLNRRSLLKGFAADVAGLMVPVTVVEAAQEVSRRYWSLGAVPELPNLRAEHDALLAWIEAYEPIRHPVLDWLPDRPYDQVVYEMGQSYYPAYRAYPYGTKDHARLSDRFLNMPRREVLSNE